MAGLPSMPSWTWTVVQGQILFDILERPGGGGLGPAASATVVSVDVQVNESQSQARGSITLKGTLRRKPPFDSSRVKWPEDNDLCFWSMDFCDIYLDHSVQVIKDCYAFDVLNFPQGPPPTGYGYPAYPNGLPLSLIHI